MADDGATLAQLLAMGARPEDLARPRVMPGGLPYMPPMSRGHGPSAEARSTNSPLGDILAQMTGQTAMGPLTTRTEDLGRGTAETVGALTGANLLPWAVERGNGLGEALAKMPVGGLASPAEAQTRAKPTDETRTLQRKLKDLGYYQGPIDGLAEGLTVKAREKFDADERAKRQQDIELGKSQAEIEASRARQKEADQRRLAEEEANKRREEGSARLREVDESIPLWRRILRDNAPMAGYVTGGVAGHLMRGAVTRYGNRVAADEAARADALISGSKGADWPSRAGAVNQFWSEGQGSPILGGAPEVPFSPKPGAQPPFRSNANAPSGAGLYQTPRLSNALQDMGVTAAGLGESGAAHVLLSGPAKDELIKARDAVDRDPSEANINRLQSALDAAAFAHGMENAGRGAAMGYVASMPVSKRDQSRPNVSAAEAERMRIDQYLARGKLSGGGGPPAPLGSPPAGSASKPTNGLAAAPSPPLALGGPRASSATDDLSLSSVLRNSPVPKPKGGSHPDHEWNSEAGRWQDIDGKFLPGPGPKD